MPFTAQHQYLTVHGDFFTGIETWQFGLRITDGGVSNQATADALAATIQNWWQGLGPFVPGEQLQTPASSHLTELKVARVQMDGTYTAEAAASHFYLPKVNGRSAQVVELPPQLATAVTLTTALPRGRGSKGRIFLPALGETNPEADGRMSAGHALVIANSIRRMIIEINGNALVGSVQVMSRGKAERGPALPNGNPTYTYPNPGVSNNVTGVRVGRVEDTQRRRRRALQEDPQAVAIG
jgi:hypothetical protein